MKGFAMGAEDASFSGDDGLVVRRYVQRAVKAEDHG